MKTSLQQMLLEKLSFHMQKKKMEPQFILNTLQEWIQNASQILIFVWVLKILHDICGARDVPEKEARRIFNSSEVRYFQLHPLTLAEAIAELIPSAALEYQMSWENRKWHIIYPYRRIYIPPKALKGCVLLPSDVIVVSLNWRLSLPCSHFWYSCKPTYRESGCPSAWSDWYLLPRENLVVLHNWRSEGCV